MAFISVLLTTLMYLEEKNKAPIPTWKWSILMSDRSYMQIIPDLKAVYLNAHLLSGSDILKLLK